MSLIVFLLVILIYAKWQLFAPSIDIPTRRRRIIPVGLFILSGAILSTSLVVPRNLFMPTFILAIISIVATIWFGIVYHRRV